MKNRKNFSRIEKMLEIPDEVCKDVPKITISGFETMIIENYRGILEYEEFFVRINTSLGILNINGFKLELENMTDDDLKITGKIESFDIERSND
jgi:sporulation protein YqfC